MAGVAARGHEVAKLSEGSKRPQRAWVSEDAWLGVWVIAVILASSASCAACRWAEHTWPEPGDARDMRVLDLERRVGQLEGKQ